MLNDPAYNRIFASGTLLAFLLSLSLNSAKCAPLSGEVGTEAIPGVKTSGGCSIAVTPDGGTVYVGNVGTANISVIDAKMMTETNVITVGDTPRDLLLSADGGTLFCANYKGSSISIINTNSKAVSATIPVDEKPDALALSPDGQRLYVGTVSNSVDIIDTSANRVTKRINVQASDTEGEISRSVYTVAVSADGHAIFVGGALRGIRVLDAFSGARLAAIPVVNQELDSNDPLMAMGGRPHIFSQEPAWASWSLVTGMVLTNGGRCLVSRDVNADIQVTDCVSTRSLRQVKLAINDSQVGSQLLAVAGNLAYVLKGLFAQSLACVDLQKLTVSEIALKGTPSAVVANAGGSKIYVVDTNVLTRIDTTSNTVDGTTDLTKPFMIK